MTERCSPPTSIYRIGISVPRPRRPLVAAPLSGSLRLHADAAVDADGLGVHVTVRDQLDRERRELLGRAEAVREEHADLESLLELLRALALPVDRRVDQTGRDGVHPDADGGEVSRDRQGHADD